MLREVPILRVMQNAQLDRHNAEILAEFAKEASDGPDPDVVYRATAVGDTRKLRGLPALARGVGGAIPGTVPGRF